MAGSGGHRPADRHATGAGGGRGGQRHADDGPADDRRLAAGDAVRPVAAVLVGQRAGRCDPGQLADRRPLGRRAAVRRTVARRARPVRHLRVVGAVTEPSRHRRGEAPREHGRRDRAEQHRRREAPREHGRRDGAEQHRRREAPREHGRHEAGAAGPPGARRCRRPHRPDGRRRATHRGRAPAVAAGLRRVGLGRARGEDRHPRGVPARLAGHRRRDAGAVRRATAVQARPATRGVPAVAARRLRRRRRRVQLPVLGPGPLRPVDRRDGRQPRRPRRPPRVLGDAARGQAAVHHRRGVEAGPAVLLVLPHRQRAPPPGARPPSTAVADRLGLGGRPSGPDLRRDPPQHVRRPRVRQPAGRRGAHRGQAPPPLPRHRDPRRRHRWRAERRQGGGPEPHRAQPAADRASSPPTPATGRARSSATSTSSPARSLPRRPSCRSGRTARCACSSTATPT